MGAVTLSTLARFALDPLLLSKFPLITFYPAIMVSSWFGGFWPGAASTVASAVLVGYFWLDPVWSFRISRPGDAVALVVFVGIGAVISGLNESLHRGRARERAARERAEHGEREHRRAQREAFVLAEELRAAQQRLTDFVESVPGVMWVAWGRPDTARQRIDFVSRYVETLLGYTVEEWLQTPNFWLSIVHPDDREHAARSAREAYTARAAQVSQFRWLTKNGVAIWVESHSIVICDGDGEPIGMRGVTLDIATRKETEEALIRRTLDLEAVETKLRRSLENSIRLGTLAERLSQPLGLAEVARSVLDRAVEALGAKAGIIRLLSDDGTTLALLDAVGFSDEWAEHNGSLPLSTHLPTAQAVRTGEPVFLESRKERVERFSGRGEIIGHAYGAGASVPLMFQGRAMGGLTLLYRGDRTFTDDDRRFILTLARLCAQAIERSRLFEAERDAKQNAERANRLKDEFLAVVSHELRTPLNAVLGWTDMLRNGILDDERRNRALEAIFSNARRQVQLIDDLLDVARIMSGKLRLERVLVDPHHVIREALEVVQPAAEAKRIQLAVDADPGVGAILADPARLHQILWNLLSNAVKFTPEHGAVRVGLRREDAAVTIVVTDSGPGIADDFLPSLFEPFRQADASTTRSHGGLGLGLSIVKHLVESHGGTVSAGRGDHGQGSAFTVRLPIVPVAAPELAPGEAPPIQLSSERDLAT
jgi:PAS domain S-box-containing protein